MTYTLGEIIYQNNLACENDIKNFNLEGEAIISFPNGCMRMENKINPEEGQKSNYVFWCDKHFPDNIQIEWEFKPLSEPGLAMVWFCAGGIKGEDLFDLQLTKRTGEYKQYFDGDINAYHLSYFRRKYEEERTFHTCNLRKSKGFHLVCQGADPIPNVEDVKSSYRIKVTKYQGEIIFYIEDLQIFSWKDDGNTYGRVLDEGKIGFRQMAPLVAEYANLKVTKILGRER